MATARMVATSGVTYAGIDAEITATLANYGLTGDAVPSDIEARTVRASRRIDGLKFKADFAGGVEVVRESVNRWAADDEVPEAVSYAVCLLAVLLSANPLDPKKPKVKRKRVQAGSASVENFSSDEEVTVSKSDAQIWADRLGLIDARVFTLLRPFLQLEDIKQDDRSRGANIAVTASAVAYANSPPDQGLAGGNPPFPSL